MHGNGALCNCLSNKDNFTYCFILIEKFGVGSEVTGLPLLCIVRGIKSYFFFSEISGAGKHLNLTINSQVSARHLAFNANTKCRDTLEPTYIKHNQNWSQLA